MVIIFSPCHIQTQYRPTGCTQKLCFSLFLLEAPPIRLKKYTYKKVLELVNSLEGNDYTEVLTLAREEKGN